MKKLLCLKCNEVRNSNSSNWSQARFNPEVDGLRTKDCRSCSIKKGKTYVETPCVDCGKIRVTQLGKETYDRCNPCSNIFRNKLKYCYVSFCPDCKNVRQNVEKRHSGTNICSKCYLASIKVYRKPKGHIYTRLCKTCLKYDFLTREAKSDNCRKCTKTIENSKRVRKTMTLTCIEPNCNNTWNVAHRHHDTNVKCRKCRTPHNKLTWHPLKCTRCGETKLYKSKDEASKSMCGSCRRIVGKRHKESKATKYVAISKKPDAKPKRVKLTQFEKDCREFLDKPKEPAKGMENRAFTNAEEAMIAKFLAKNSITKIPEPIDDGMMNRKMII